MSASLAIQESIYDILIASLSVPVYDDVPDNAVMPYVVIGDDTVVEYDTDGKTGFDATLTIHTWSKYRGRFEVKTIMGQIYTLLHRQDYDINEYNILGLDHEFEQTFLEADGVTRHGVQRFRLLLIKGL